MAFKRRGRRRFSRGRRSYSKRRGSAGRRSTRGLRIGHRM